MKHLLTVALLLCFSPGGLDSARCLFWVSDPDNCLVESRTILGGPEDYPRFSSGPFGTTVSNIKLCEFMAHEAPEEGCRNALSCGTAWGCVNINEPTPAWATLFTATLLSGDDFNFGVESSGLVPGPKFTAVRIEHNLPASVCINGRYRVKINAMQGRVVRGLVTKVFYVGNTTSVPDQTLIGPVGGTGNSIILPGVPGSVRIEMSSTGCGCMQDSETKTIQVEARYCDPIKDPDVCPPGCENGCNGDVSLE